MIMKHGKRKRKCQIKYTTISLQQCHIKREPKGLQEGALGFYRAPIIPNMMMKVTQRETNKNRTFSFGRRCSKNPKKKTFSLIGRII